MKKRFQKLLGDKDFSELIKGGGISFFFRLAGQFIGYLLTLIIANLFGAKGLGDYVLAITILKLFSVLAKFGLDTASIRFIASYASKEKWQSVLNLRKKVVNILSVTTVISSLLMFFLATSISDLINIDIKYIRLNAFFVIPMVFFMLHYESLRGLKKIAEFSFFYRMSQALISIIAIVIIYQFTNDSEVPIYAYLISVLVVSILAYLSYRYHLLKHLNPKDSVNEDFMSYSKLLSISIPLMFAESVQFIMVWIDKLMLGNMTSVEDVGIYFTAFKLSMIASISLMSINSIASPKFAEKFGKNDINGLRKVVQQSTKMIFWTSFPLVVVFFIIPEYLLSLFGEEFKVGVTAFIFLSCGRLVSSFCGSVGNILKMTNNQNIFGLLLFCGAIINVVLNLVLIPEDNFLSIYGLTGINGAAFASMCSLSFWNLAMVIIVKRKFGFFTFYLPYFKR